jgi:hypothetical protein
MIEVMGGRNFSNIPAQQRTTAENELIAAFELI